MEQFIHWQIENPEIVGGILLGVALALHIPWWAGWLED